MIRTAPPTQRAAPRVSDPLGGGIPCGALTEQSGCSHATNCIEFHSPAGPLLRETPLQRARTHGKHPSDILQRQPRAFEMRDQDLADALAPNSIGPICGTPR